MFVVDIFACKEIGEEDALGGDDERRILSVLINDDSDIDMDSSFNFLLFGAFGRSRLADLTISQWNRYEVTLTHKKFLYFSYHVQCKSIGI